MMARPALSEFACSTMDRHLTWANEVIIAGEAFLKKKLGKGIQALIKQGILPEVKRWDLQTVHMVLEDLSEHSAKISITDKDEYETLRKLLVACQIKSLTSMMGYKVKSSDLEYPDLLFAIGFACGYSYKFRYEDAEHLRLLTEHFFRVGSGIGGKTKA